MDYMIMLGVLMVGMVIALICVLVELQRCFDSINELYWILEQTGVHITDLRKHYRSYRDKDDLETREDDGDGA